MHHKTLYRTVTLAHADKSGGRQPPVVREPAIPKTIRFRFNADRHKSGCGNAIATASANAPATVCRAIAEAPLQVRCPFATASSRPPLLGMLVRTSQISRFCRRVVVYPTRNEEAGAGRYWCGFSNGTRSTRIPAAVRTASSACLIARWDGSNACRRNRIGPTWLKLSRENSSRTFRREKAPAYRSCPQWYEPMGVRQ